MLKIELYTGQKTYMFPVGTIATPDEMTKQFPAIQVFPHIIETDVAGQICYAVENFAAMKSLHNIPQDTPDATAISMLEAIINAPAPEPEVSAEERIAAALEFGNLLSM